MSHLEVEEDIQMDIPLCSSEVRELPKVLENSLGSRFERKLMWVLILLLTAPWL